MPRKSGKTRGIPKEGAKKELADSSHDETLIPRHQRKRLMNPGIGLVLHPCPLPKIDLHKGSTKRKGTSSSERPSKQRPVLMDDPAEWLKLLEASEDELSHDSCLDSDSEEDQEETVPSANHESPDVCDVRVSEDIGDVLGSEDEGQPQVVRPEDKWFYDPPLDKTQIPFVGGRRLKLLPESVSPSGFFNLLLTVGIIEIIVNQMNLYAEEVLGQSEGEHARISRWKPVTVEEFKVFLGISFHMGIVRLNRINDYWKTDYRFNIPFFRKYMARNRYLLLMRTLHFCSNDEDDGSDRIYKIRPLFDYFNRRMDEVYSVGKELSLDESMVFWRGRLNFREYIKNKRHRYGIKLHVLAEPTGLVQRLLVYGGLSDKDVGGKRHAEKVVNNLMAGRTGKGHSLFMDSFYNSVTLAEALLDEKTFCTGTLQANRKGNPAAVVRSKLKGGDSISMFTEKGICVTKWKDNRDVLCLSSEFSGQHVTTKNRRGIETQKPELIVQYNNYMKGVDRQDQMMSYYPACYKSLRWYKKLALHIFQILLINAQFLHNDFRGDGPFINIYDFRLAVVEALVGGPPPPEVPRERPAAIHLPEPCPKDAKGKTIRRRCKLCWEKGKERRSCLFYCPLCPNEPGLCIKPCFREFHGY